MYERLLQRSKLLHAVDTAISQADRMPQAVDTDFYRRRSIGMPATAPLHPLKAGRSSMAAAGQAYTANPASALQYLADTGSKVKELESEVSEAHSEIISLNQQLQDAENSLRASAKSLAIVQGEKDFLQAQRDSERVDMEVQIQKAEQRIAALSQDLRHADAAKVMCIALAQPRVQTVVYRHARVVKICHFLQAKAAEDAETSIAEANDQASQARNLAATRKQKVQQLQHELQLAQHQAQEADLQKATAAKRQQSQAQAHAQQLQLLKQQLAEAQSQAELHNQKRLQAEERATALQLQQVSAVSPQSDDSALLQNLRDQLASQSADIVEARRLNFFCIYCCMFEIDTMLQAYVVG